ncbi:MAG: hypothetical protein ISS49_11440 [Anaerolineae bacterium]|nr:hypothetical protein [Anaerolineae bacterium]
MSERGWPHPLTLVIGHRSLVIFLAFLGYALLILVMTYPVVFRLGTHLVGFGDDMRVHYWNNWWVKKVLTEGGSIYSTRLLFYPQTVSLVYHNFGWVNIAGWLLVEPVVGGIAAYNLVYLANVTLCAFAMFILARYLLRSEGAAFVAGLVYGCWPYRLSDTVHPNMISTEWLPLVLLCVILLVREGGRVRYALLAGLFLALTGLSRWQMLVPAGIAVCAYLLFSVSCERARWSWRVVGALALAALVAALLMAVPFYPLARDLVTGEAGDQLYLNLEAETQTDLLAYFVPPMNHPLALLFDDLGYARSPARLPYSAFLGYAVLAVVMMAVVWRWQAARPWAVLALGTFLLALGPVLRFDGRLYPAMPMPYRLVGWLAPLRLMRNPHRFNTLLALPVAMLAGHGAAALRDRLARRWSLVVDLAKHRHEYSRWHWSFLLWGVLSVLVLFDYFNLPVAMVPNHVPDFYLSIAEAPDDFAIVGLPGDRQNAERYMFYQTVHGRPLLDGHISRVSSQALAFISSVPLVDGVYESGTINTRLPDLSRQLSLLAQAGFRYIVLHKELASREQLAEWRSYLVVSPCYEDEEVVVYSTAPVVGRDCSLRYALGAGIGLIEAALSTETVSPDGVLELRAIWATTTDPGMDLKVEVALVPPPLSSPPMGGNEGGDEGWPHPLTQVRCFAISPAWPTGEWPANTIVRDRYSFHIEPWLRDGKHRVVVRLVRAGDGGPVGERVEVGEVAMLAQERGFTVPDMTRTVGATFGDALQLLGYDLERGGGVIHVTLHWQALRRMEVPYKFFVHLYDAESESLVAQVDVMPHNWTYPTTWWEVDEVVSDEISLPLEDLPQGRYWLGVGVYHPDTGARLPVVEAPVSLDSSDGRLLLPEVIER